MRQYRIITTPRQDRLEMQVTELLNEGWDVWGPPTQSPTGGYLQALIKEIKAKKSASKVS